MKSKSSLEMKNIAIIGCGPWGKNHVRVFHQLGYLHTICDIDKECLEELAKKYKNIKTEQDYKKVLQNKDIKAVVIATPTDTHYKIAKEALLANKDVFVEKPLAINKKEAEELKDIAQEKNRIIMVGHILKYHPGIIKLKELIKEGELGKINYIYSNRLNFGKIRREENILLSFAPHDISIILYLLDEMPIEVSAYASNYINPYIADVTLSTMKFASGVNSHIFVSWLHPYKEQKLIVVGDRKMAVFDDVKKEDKLILYEHKIEWKNRIPITKGDKGYSIRFDMKEPLLEEAKHFVECVKGRKKPFTDVEEGIRVLEILDKLQESIHQEGKIIKLKEEKEFFIHPTSYVDRNVKIGKDSKIWHFTHIMEGAEIGNNCNIGQNVFIGKGVKIGNNVKIQNNVSIYEKVELEDNVFCGPSCCFTNIKTPRAFISRKQQFEKTLVKEGATIGANATIICGVTIGRFALIGAGSVVTKDVGNHQIVVGNPAKLLGYACHCGVRLEFENNKAVCKECKNSYLLKDNNGIELVLI